MQKEKRMYLAIIVCLLVLIGVLIQKNLYLATLIEKNIQYDDFQVTNAMVAYDNPVQNNEAILHGFYCWSQWPNQDIAFFSPNGTGRYYEIRKNMLMPVIDFVYVMKNNRVSMQVDYTTIVADVSRVDHGGIATVLKTDQDEYLVKKCDSKLKQLSKLTNQLNVLATP